jgi:hypothetical protein
LKLPEPVRRLLSTAQRHSSKDADSAPLVLSLPSGHLDACSAAHQQFSIDALSFVKTNGCGMPNEKIEEVKWFSINFTLLSPNFESHIIINIHAGSPHQRCRRGRWCLDRDDTLNKV